MTVNACEPLVCIREVWDTSILWRYFFSMKKPPITPIRFNEILINMVYHSLDVLQYLTPCDTYTEYFIVSIYESFCTTVDEVCNVDLDILSTYFIHALFVIIIIILFLLMYMPPQGPWLVNKHIFVFQCKSWVRIPQGRFLQFKDFIFLKCKLW